MASIVVIFGRIPLNPYNSLNYNLGTPPRLWCSKYYLPVEGDISKISVYIRGFNYSGTYRVQLAIYNTATNPNLIAVTEERSIAYGGSSGFIAGWFDFNIAADANGTPISHIVLPSGNYYLGVTSADGYLYTQYEDGYCSANTPSQEYYNSASCTTAGGSWIPLTDTSLWFATTLAVAGFPTSITSYKNYGARNFAIYATYDAVPVNPDWYLVMQHGEGGYTNPSITGMPVEGWQIPYNTYQDCTATANPDYQFDGWSLETDPTIVSTSTTYRIGPYTDGSTHILVAHFSLIPIVIVPPTVATLAVGTVTETTATLNGNITDLSDAASCDQRGFDICTTAEYDGWQTYTRIYDPTSGPYYLGTYSFSVSPLTPITEYVVRAFARNSAGIGYGVDLRFSTQETPPSPGYIGTQETDNDALYWYLAFSGVLTQAGLDSLKTGTHFPATSPLDIGVVFARLKLNRTTAPTKVKALIYDSYENLIAVSEEKTITDVAFHWESFRFLPPVHFDPAIHGTSPKLAITTTTTTTGSNFALDFVFIRRGDTTLSEMNSDLYDSPSNPFWASDPFTNPLPERATADAEQNTHWGYPNWFWCIYATSIAPYPPTPNFAVSGAPIAGQPANFMSSYMPGWDGSNTSSPAHYYWDFGEGAGFAEGLASPTHTFGAEGAYTVRLYVVDNAGQTSITVQKTVYVLSSSPFQSWLIDFEDSDFMSQLQQKPVGVNGDVPQMYPLQSENSRYSVYSLMGSVDAPNVVIERVTASSLEISPRPGSTGIYLLRMRIGGTSDSDRRIHLRHIWNPVGDKDIWVDEWIYFPADFPIDDWTEFLALISERVLDSQDNSIVSSAMTISAMAATVNGEHIIQILENSGWTDMATPGSPAGYTWLDPQNLTVPLQPFYWGAPLSERNDDLVIYATSTNVGIRLGQWNHVVAHIYRPTDVAAPKTPCDSDAGGFYEVWINDTKVTWNRKRGNIPIASGMDRVYTRTCAAYPDKLMGIQVTTGVGAGFVHQRAWVESGIDLYSGVFTSPAYAIQTKELYFDDVTLSTKLATLEATIDPRQQIAAVGDTVTFTCYPSKGQSPYTYSWKVNGSIIGVFTQQLQLSTAGWAAQTYPISCVVADSQTPPTSVEPTASLILQPTVLVTVQAGANGSITNSGTQSFTVGISYDFNTLFNPTPTTVGYYFDHWNLSTKGDIISPYTFAIDDASATLTAVFAQQQQITVTVTALPPEGGTTDKGTGTNLILTTGDTITAQTNSNYVFLRWLLTGAEYSREPTITITLELLNNTLTAEFTPISQAGFPWWVIAVGGAVAIGGYVLSRGGKKKKEKVSTTHVANSLSLYA